MTTYTHSFPYTESTMLAVCEYDDENSELTVEFKNGRRYTYVDVEKSTYDSLISAPSPGRYFNSIKVGLKQK